MANDPPKTRNWSRREFLTLAGAGAVVGALVLALSKPKGVQGLLKSTVGRQTNPATAGKFIQTSAPAAAPSWLEKLLGGKL